MTVRVRTLPGAADALLAEPQVKALVSAGAKAVAANAATIAPVLTGALRSSYRSTPARREPTRIVATAYSTGIAALVVEYGGAYHPTYAPLRRGSERAGLRAVRRSTT